MSEMVLYAAIGHAHTVRLSASMNMGFYTNRVGEAVNTNTGKRMHHYRRITKLSGETVGTRGVRAVPRPIGARIISI